MSAPRVVYEVRSALKSYLQTNLTTGVSPPYPGAVVSEFWPTPQKAVPAQAVTVVSPGKPTLRYLQDVPWVTTATTGHAGTTIYLRAMAEIPLQLDVWTQAQAVRDGLAAAVGDFLNRAAATTVATPALQEFLAGPDLVLNITNLYGFPCNYDFDALPEYIDSPLAAERSEWRATWAGKALLYIPQQENVYLMEQILLELGLNGGPLEQYQLEP